MILVKQINPQRRIILKKTILDWQFKLQVKKWYGWKNIAWAYPSCHKGESVISIEKYLEWKVASKRWGMETTEGMHASNFLKKNNL